MSWPWSAPAGAGAKSLADWGNGTPRSPFKQHREVVMRFVSPFATRYPHAPVLLGRLHYRNRAYGPEVRIVVYCPCCNATHEHGWTGRSAADLDVAEHRTAHCRDGSPLKRTGYFFLADPRYEEESLAVVALRETMRIVVEEQARSASEIHA